MIYYSKETNWLLLLLKTGQPRMFTSLKFFETCHQRKFMSAKCKNFVVWPDRKCLSAKASSFRIVTVSFFIFPVGFNIFIIIKFLFSIPDGSWMVLDKCCYFPGYGQLLMLTLKLISQKRVSLFWWYFFCLRQVNITSR